MARLHRQGLNAAVARTVAVPFAPETTSVALIERWVWPRDDEPPDSMIQMDLLGGCGDRFAPLPAGLNLLLGARLGSGDLRANFFPTTTLALPIVDDRIATRSRVGAALELNGRTVADGIDYVNRIGRALRGDPTVAGESFMTPLALEDLRPLPRDVNGIVLPRRSVVIATVLATVPDDEPTRALTTSYEMRIDAWLGDPATALTSVTVWQEGTTVGTNSFWFEGDPLMRPDERYLMFLTSPPAGQRQWHPRSDPWLRFRVDADGRLDPVHHAWLGSGATRALAGLPVAVAVPLLMRAVSDRDAMMGARASRSQ